MRWGGSWGEPTKGLGVPWGPGVQPTCVSATACAQAHRFNVPSISLFSPTTCPGSLLGKPGEGQPGKQHRIEGWVPMGCQEELQSPSPLAADHLIKLLHASFPGFGK